MGDRVRANGVPCDSEEGNNREVCIDAVLCPVDDGLLVAVFAAVPRSNDREDDRGQHTADGEVGSNSHVADQNAGDHCADHSSRAGLLGDLVRGGGDNVGLQGLVVLENAPHVLPAQMLVRLVGTAEVLGLVIGADADANQQHADKRSNDRDSRGGGQIGLAVVNGIAGLGDGDLSVFGQQHGVEDDREGHRDDVVEHRVPHADGGTLLRVIGHQGRKRLRGHVHYRVTDDVEHVGREEHSDAKTLAGSPGEHGHDTKGLHCPAEEHQGPDLAPAGVDTVVEERQKRVGDGVKNAGEGQQAADDQRRDAEADAGCIGRLPDQRVDGHAVEGVAGDENDLPEFCSAVLHAVDLAGAEFFLCHDDTPFLLFRCVRSCDLRLL